MGFPGGLEGKVPACNARDPGSIPRQGISPGEGMATHSSTLAWKIPQTEGLHYESIVFKHKVMGLEL